MIDLDKLFIPSIRFSDKHPDKITMLVSNEYGLFDEFVYDWDGREYTKDEAKNYIMEYGK